LQKKIYFLPIQTITIIL